MSTTSAEPFVASPSLTVTIDPGINNAFQQTAIPLVKELRFRNEGVARKDLISRVTTEPAFAAPAETFKHAGKPAGTRVGFRMH